MFEYRESFVSLFQLTVNRKVFSGDVDKYRFLQMLQAAFERKRCKAYAFVLLDDALWILLRGDTEGKELCLETFTQKYLPYYETMYPHDKECIETTSSLHMIAENEIQGVTNDVHILPLRYRYCNDLSGWYWSSYVSYLGECRWSFLDTEKLLKQISLDQETAHRVYIKEMRMYCRREMKSRKGP